MGTFLTSLAVGIVIATIAATLANVYASGRDRRNYSYDKKRETYLSFLKNIERALLREAQGADTSEIMDALEQDRRAIRFFAPNNIDDEARELHWGLQSYLEEPTADAEARLLHEMRMVEWSCKYDLNLPPDKYRWRDRYHWYGRKRKHLGD